MRLLSVFFAETIHRFDPLPSHRRNNNAQMGRHDWFNLSPSPILVSFLGCVETAVCVLHGLGHSRGAHQTRVLGGPNSTEQSQSANGVAGGGGGVGKKGFMHQIMSGGWLPSPMSKVNLHFHSSRSA